jgi:hypothetical protein
VVILQILKLMLFELCKKTLPFMFRLEFAFGFDFLTFFFITIRFQNVIFITFEQNLTGLVS